MTVLVGKFTSQAAFVVWLAFVGNAVCQNLDCPDGITNIQAASGSIAYPGSSSTYGENQTKCWRIVVPDTEIYSGIGIYYNMFDVEQCDFCACDSLTLVDYRYGRWRVSKKCGRQTSLYLDFLHFVDGDPDNSYSSNELYLQFSSDDSVNLKGFNLSFIAKISSTYIQNFLNASKDETIQFASRKFGIKNYPAGYDEEWFLIVPPGLRVEITFEEFELELSPNCRNAFVAIRETYREDGPYDVDIDGDYGSIIADPMCGDRLPGKMLSVGNMAWVKFRSSNNASTSFKGFKASFKSVGSYGAQCCDCKCGGKERVIADGLMVLVFLISAILVIQLEEKSF